MSDKKFTTEQLEEQCEEARKAFVRLKEQLEEQKRAEEEQKQAELALAQENRKKEVEDARDNFQKILKAYIQDYGSISITSDADEWPPFFSSKPWHWWF